MSDKRYPVPAGYHGNLGREQYDAMYRRSIEDPETFWAEQARTFLTWDAAWETLHEENLREGHTRWFMGGRLNAAANCIDRHLPERANQTAIIWEGDDPADAMHISYQQLHDEVCRLANLLKARGVTRGDRVCIYMPMIPEAAYAMLACARIGAVHSVVFGGFSPEALKDRILDSDCRVVITADEGIRGAKTIPLKGNTDQAVSACPNVHSVLVFKHTGGDVAWNAELDIDAREAMNQQPADCVPESMDAEDPMFILYTSGSTGKPKGVLHTTGGYMLQAAMTHRYILDYQEGDIYWCTADVGWVTGHSYIVYGPLTNGATTLMFEGVPTYPDVSRCWEVVDKHQVSIFYTAPTAIRALMAHGDAPVQKTSRRSLRLLGTVGEPINPEAWEWYHRVVGDGRCPIVDTWWQTETGAIMIAPVPGAFELKPGSATLPFFGVLPGLVDDNGKLIEATEARGNLVIRQSWPSQIRTVFGDHERCINTYYTAYPGFYFTGDGARRDADGYYWITGRVDDVLNVSGHRIGTAEVESALVLHECVAEAAVVGFEHAVKGQGIYAYVTPMLGADVPDDFEAQLRQMCVQEIGAFARPDILHITPGLPKTRSGKIMRRILRKIAANEFDSLGDTSTLADPGIVHTLIDQHQALN